MVKTKTTKKEQQQKEQPKKRTASRGKQSTDTGKPDEVSALTVDQLANLTREVLILRCQELKIFHKKLNKQQLAERIYAAYHPAKINPPPVVDIGDELQEPGESVDTVAYANEDADANNDGDDGDKSGSSTSSNSSSSSSSSESEDSDAKSRKRKRTVTKVNLQEMIQNVMENTIGEEVRTITAQVNALQSEVSAVKGRNNTPAATSRPVTPATPTLVNSSPRKRKSGDHDGSSSKRSRSSSSSSSRQKSASSNSGMRYSSSYPVGADFSASRQLGQKNRFRLPAMEKKYLDSIEKGKYVDFDRLKKKKLDSKSRDTNRTEYDLKVNENTRDTTLCLKKSKRDVISTPLEWMAVWCDYLHARLHFRPHEAYELFKYQKHMIDFFGSYKFEAVKAYDIDFRNLIANQRSEPQEERTAFWDQQNTELKNLHLVDHPKPPPQCYNCSEKGHVSNECTKPSKKQSQSKNSFNNHSTITAPTYTFPSAYYPPPPPPPQPRPQKQNGATAPPAVLDKNNREHYCRGFNSQGECRRGIRCRWLHQCNKCTQEGHGGIACDNFTTTQFRGPQQGP